MPPRARRGRVRTFESTQLEKLRRDAEAALDRQQILEEQFLLTRREAEITDELAILKRFQGQVRYEHSDDPLDFQFASDLNLDLQNPSDPALIDDVLTPVANNLVLLGNIAPVFHPAYRDFLIKHGENFDWVFIVAGPREFYNDIDSDQRYTVEMCKKRIRDICAESEWENLIFMDKTSFETNNVRILGTTLWTFVPDEHRRAVSAGLDYGRIFIGPETSPKNITVSDTIHWHMNELEWLRGELIKSARAGEPYCLVLTHHCPSMRGTMHVIDESSQYAAATDLRRLFRGFGGNIHTWLFGRTLYNVDQIQYGTRLCSNQLGTPDSEARGGLFSPAYQIHIPDAESERVRLQKRLKTLEQRLQDTKEANDRVRAVPLPEGVPIIPPSQILRNKSVCDVM